MEFIYKGDIYEYIQNEISGNLVFDIGSNIGEISKRLTDLNCKVISVEPQLELISNKNYSNVFSIKNFCVSDKFEIVNFYKCEKNTSSSCIENWGIDRHHKKKWTKTKMPTITLDSLINEFGIPKYIKIDTEGYEDRVLMGLSSKVDLISFEFTKWNLSKSIRCYDILENKFGIKQIRPFIKKKIKNNIDNKIIDIHAYSDVFNDKNSFLEYLEKFDNLSIKYNRDVGDLLVIM